VLVASDVQTGFPTTILSRGTPFSAIYFTAVPGKLDPELTKSFSYVS